MIITGLSHWKRNEVKAHDSDAANFLKVCQPSLGDLRRRIAEQRKKIEDYETPDFQKMEEDLANGEFIVPKQLTKHNVFKGLVNREKELQAQFEDFLNGGNTHLGHVFAGSGLYSAKKSATIQSSELPSIRDWALVDVEDARMGDNTVS
jgi:hypothetical protein